jgi:hypothetical protein
VEEEEEEEKRGAGRMRKLVERTTQHLSLPGSSSTTFLI